MSRNIPRNALITGASKRLGREIAIALANKGWNIAIHHNTSPPDEVLAELEKTGVKVTSVKADLLNSKEFRKIIPEAAKKLGEITLLINSASIFEKIKFMETDENTFDSNFDIHVKAPFFLSQDFAIQCHSGGQIINIIDSNSIRNKTLHFAYLLSKKSLRNLSHMLSYELGPKIRVNSILPGPLMEYPGNDGSEYLDKRKNSLPLKEFATSKEVISALLYLVDSTLTGQEIFVDGGEQLL